MLEVQNNFGNTEYQAKKARQLFNEKRLLAISPLYNGKVLAKDVEDSVKTFYNSRYFCQTVPGKKVYISIGKNIH